MRGWRKKGDLFSESDSNTTTQRYLQNSFSWRCHNTLCCTAIKTMLISFDCAENLTTLWLHLRNTKRRVGRVYPSITNCCSLAATLRVFRLNSLEKQLFCAYMKHTDSSDLLFHCRVAVGTGWTLGTDSFHLKLLRNGSEGPSGVPCSVGHSGILSFFFIANTEDINWQLVWAGTVLAHIIPQISSESISLTLH